MKNKNMNTDIIKYGKKIPLMYHFKKAQIIIILAVILINFGIKILSENPALKVLIFNKSAREYWMNLLYDEMYVAGNMSEHYLYKNKIPSDDVIHSSACQGMLNGYGNQYNYFLTKAQKDEFFNSTEDTEKFGLGGKIKITYERTNEGNLNYDKIENLKFINVQRDSPLEKAGVKPGDIIVQVNNFVFRKFEDYLSEEEKLNKIFVSDDLNGGFDINEVARILTALGDFKIFDNGYEQIVNYGSNLESYPKVHKLLSDDQIEMIKNPEVNLKVLRYNEETGEWCVINFTLKKQTFKFNAVEYSVITDGNGNDIGYMRLENFSRSGRREFEEFLNRLIRRKINSLVIDLRDNPGGFIDVLDRLLTLFIKDKILYETKGRGKGTDKKIKAKNVNFKTDIPIVVLVNENSISSSEMFARVVQHTKRGLVVGSSTRGKGVLQSVFSLPTGSEQRIVVSEWFVGGVSINDSGVKPDIYAESNLSKSDIDVTYNLDADIALNAAINHLSGSTKKIVKWKVKS